MPKRVTKRTIKKALETPTPDTPSEVPFPADLADDTPAEQAKTEVGAPAETVMPPGTNVTAYTRGRTVDVPIADEPEGYASNRINVRLSPKHTHTLSCVRTALKRQNKAATNAEVVRWLLDQLAGE